MSRYNLLHFQKTAVDELTETFIRLWKTGNYKIPLVFKSPTGSGKTLMTANFIHGLNHLPNWNHDKAFIWITFSDDLAMQSKEKFKIYFSTNLENDLLTVNDINRGKLNKNDILFINWQKLVQDNAATRKLKLRKPKNPEEKKESGSYFEDVIDKTKDEKREIILIVDESHKNSKTELAKEIIDYINPRVILNVSATPEHEPSASDTKHFRAGLVEVEREEVVAEGLIKEKIVVQTDEDLQKHKGKDLDEVLLDLGIEKRNELKEEYAKHKKEINPLLIIQLPNDDNKLIELGQKTKENVMLDYLKSKKVREDEIALWFDGKQKNMEFITDNDSKINFMLFKQAAGTGWDCPRASVLVMFREISSPTFYTQTVGRILRMAEPDKKNDYKNSPNLRTGFLYTNYKRNEVKIPDQSQKNKPLTQFAFRKKEIDVSKFILQSAYVSRVDYGDLSNSAKFQMSFINSMNKYFSLNGDDILDKAREKLEKKEIDLTPSVTNEIIVNAQYDDLDHLDLDFKKKGKDLKLEMSRNDVEKTFNYLCYGLLKEQTEIDAIITNIARSWSPLKSAFRVWFKQVLGDDSNYYYRVFINDISKDASSKFRPALTQALKEYRPLLKTILEQRKKETEEKESPIFTIQEEYQYTDDYKEVEQNLCVLDKFFLLENYDGRENEIEFMKYIDSKKKQIEWWFKNGNSGKDFYAIKYSNTTFKQDSLFYPDWIIKFNDGRIGIFDSKKGNTAINTEGRAEALAKKLKELGKKFVGGIAVKENGVWYYNCSENYEYTPGKLNKDWKTMEDVF